MPRTNTTTPATLRRILQQELTLGNRLLALAQEESDVIVRNDVERLLHPASAAAAVPGGAAEIRSGAHGCRAGPGLASWAWSAYRPCPG